jgi:alkanesulfonate monooxygenase SsuD/methylene tetrahydromethanopterin reductase-like flavin-dependent oxidoreductase (luciferase family)
LDTAVLRISYVAMAGYRPPRESWPGWSTWAAPPAAYDPEIGQRAMAETLAEVRLADELGFDWVSVSEHHYGPFTLTPNSAVWAAAVSQHARRARIALLGPLVSISNPVRVAEEIAMLDTLSGGRVVVLFLRGTPNEFATYHVNPDETRARTREASLLIARALSEPRPFGWEGRFFRYRHVSVWPGTVQRPHPPLFSSGNSFESATFAARHRHGLAMSFVPPEYVARVVHHYRVESARSGWEPTREHVLWRHWAVVGSSPEEAEEIRASFFGEERRPASPSQHTTGVVGVCGTPETVLEQLRALHDLGVGVVDLILNYGYAGHQTVARELELLGAEVLPRAHDLGAAEPGGERTSFAV